MFGLDGFGGGIFPRKIRNFLPSDGMVGMVGIVNYSSSHNHGMWKMGSWKMCGLSPNGLFSTSMIMGGRDITSFPSFFVANEGLGWDQREKCKKF